MTHSSHSAHVTALRHDAPLYHWRDATAHEIDGLIDAGGQLVGELATSWEPDATAMRWEFAMRRGSMAALSDIMLNPDTGMKPIRMIMAGRPLLARVRSRIPGRYLEPRSRFGLRRRGDRGILCLAAPSRQLQRTLEGIES